MDSARALDGDEFLAAAAATEAGIGGNSPGNLVAIHLAKRTGLGKFTRLAVRGRNGHAAARTAGQASIDAVTVGIVGDDEHALFRPRRAQAKGKGKREDHER